ncbi:hypothetical protein ACOMHN_007390 [Nucella lapillus]
MMRKWGKKWGKEGAFEKLFNRLPNHVITVSHQRKVPEVSVEQCARRCVFEMTFHCKGFDYEPQHRNCWLTDLNVETSGSGVKFHHGADFYERILGEGEGGGKMPCT